MEYRAITIADYDQVYALWMSCKSMGFNDVDDSREGIARLLDRNPGLSFAALLVFKYNEPGNAFWESQGFTLREDVAYRNRALRRLIRLDT